MIRIKNVSFNENPRFAAGNCSLSDQHADTALFLSMSYTVKNFCLWMEHASHYFFAKRLKYHILILLNQIKNDFVGF